MNRRLYFLFPYENQAVRVAQELTRMGVPSSRMHGLVRNGEQLRRLLPATPDQASDRAYRIDRNLWNGNLLLFFVALAAFVLALFSATAWAAFTALAVMAITFGLGFERARLPDAHVEEFHDALDHGEVLLMVDVPAKQVADVEATVQRHHPEAVLGGIGLGFGAYGI